MSNLNNTKLQNSHCKNELALLVGDDLSEAEAVSVKRHMAVCPECREHYQNLQQAMQPLQDFVAQAPPAPQVDLWSRVEEQITATSHIQRRRHLFHTLAPAVSVVVACTLLFMVMGRGTDQSRSNGFVTPTTTVRGPAMNVRAINNAIQRPAQEQKPQENRTLMYDQFGYPVYQYNGGSTQ